MNDIDLAEIWRRMRALAAVARGKPDLKWATVRAVNPTSVQIDGDEAPLLAAPSTLVTGVSVGSRVLVALHQRRATIIGHGGKLNWQPLPLSDRIDVHQGQRPEWAIAGGKLHLQGALTRSSGSFSTSYVSVIPGGGIPDLPGVRDGYKSVRLLASGGGAPPGRSYISASGEMLIATTGGTASYYTLNSEYLIDS
ncbi:hypothetical protein K8P10_001995 [Leucobacter sp. Psy1]|uniref:hypothetical protein n=1 Tax=Leucobacter sp. Psy1 TaxID=2875729 RepID=UPI001CD1CD0B|nr:hypothetical protein [Leucobacter sp. Psy1]UBH06484.1 hypothetical protein K8P10_001995 [Leucobacter sp. Psy1]